MSIDLILYVIAAVCFALAAAGFVTGRVNILAVGLFAWVLTNLV